MKPLLGCTKLPPPPPPNKIHKIKILYFNKKKYTGAQKTPPPPLK